MLDFLFNIYFTSTVLALCTAIMYLGKLKRIIQAYELELYLDVLSVVVLIGLCFVPLLNLYIGAINFSIGVIGTDKEFIEELFGKEDEGDK